MTGRTHVAIAVAGALAAGVVGGPASGSFVLASAIGALIPDLDNTHSTLGSDARLGWVHKIPGLGNHRGFTHSLVFALAVYVLARVLAPGAEQLLIRAAAAGNFVPALSTMQHLLGAGVPAGLLLGLVSHDVSDLLNREGVQLLWPLPKRWALYLFASASLVDQLVRYSVLALLLAWRWPLGIGAVITTEALWFVL